MPGPAQTGDRPTDLLTYKQWLEGEHDVAAGAPLKTRYETIVAKVQADFLRSPLWERVTAALPDFDGAYRLKADNYPLFLNPDTPTVHSKSFDSFLLKTFRRNVLENTAWPAPPDCGWLVPDAWYSQLNDLVRTTF